MTVVDQCIVSGLLHLINADLGLWCNRATFIMPHSFELCENATFLRITNCNLIAELFVKLSLLCPKFMWKRYRGQFSLPLIVFLTDLCRECPKINCWYLLCRNSVSTTWHLARWLPTALCICSTWLSSVVRYLTFISWILSHPLLHFLTVIMIRIALDNGETSVYVCYCGLLWLCRIQYNFDITYSVIKHTQL